MRHQTSWRVDNLTGWGDERIGVQACGFACMPGLRVEQAGGTEWRDRRAEQASETGGQEETGGTGGLERWAKQTGWTSGWDRRAGCPAGKREDGTVNW